ncbi:hypothetical protein HDU93_004943, partial [Gonapodya sp. JEL0774]
MFTLPVLRPISPPAPPTWLVRLTIVLTRSPALRPRSHLEGRNAHRLYSSTGDAAAHYVQKLKRLTTEYGSLRTRPAVGASSVLSLASVTFPRLSHSDVSTYQPRFWRSSTLPPPSTTNQPRSSPFSFLRTAYLDFVGLRRARSLLGHPAYTVPEQVAQNSVDAVMRYFEVVGRLAQASQANKDGLGRELREVASSAVGHGVLQEMMECERDGLVVEVDVGSKTTGTAALPRSAFRFTIGPHTEDGRPLDGYEAHDWFGHVKFMFPKLDGGSHNPGSDGAAGSPSPTPPSSSHALERSLVQSATSWGTRIHATTHVTTTTPVTVTVRRKDTGEIVFQDAKSEFVVVVESGVVRLRNSDGNGDGVEGAQGDGVRDAEGGWRWKVADVDGLWDQTG